MLCVRHAPKRLTKNSNPALLYPYEFWYPTAKSTKKKGIGIEQLAPELGMSSTYLSKFEHNQVRPSRVVNDLKCEQVLPSNMSTCPQS